MKRNIEPLFIKPEASIKQAMQTITEAGRLRLPVGIALVINDDKQLVGTVTDGDIRKALVKGMSMDAPVNRIMAKEPITVPENLTVDSMIKMVMDKVKQSQRINDYKVNQVIVTTSTNRVIDVLDFYELWSKQEVGYKNVCVVGTGHVGLTLSVVLAELGYQVTGFDINYQLVEKLNKGTVTFYEKGLEPLLKFHLKEENIKFTAKLDGIQADIYVICVGTPINEETQKPILTYIEKAVADVGRVLKKEDTVILRSTVTVGTTRGVVMPILEERSSLKAGIDFYLAFAPERVVEGNALEEMKEIPQIVGGINKKSAQEAARLLQTICPSVVMLDSLEEAELIKLINNTYRDHSFAFANKIVLLCDQLKIDAVKILKAAGEGYPRNPIPLPSPGVGGYCLTKDPYLMADVAKSNKIDPDIFIHSRTINNQMPKFVASKITQFIKEHCAKEKLIKVYCLGFAFKGFPETSDMRGSPAIDVVNHLHQNLNGKLQLTGYDSVVHRDSLEGAGISYLPYREGFKDAHCVLIMNNHPDFAKIDIFSLLESMRKPGLFFDGWHFFLPAEIRKVKGIVYQGLGGFH